MLQVSLKSLPSQNKVAPKSIGQIQPEKWLRDFTIGLPQMEGNPIFLEFLPQLTAWRGKLLTGQAQRGRAVHAASFLRKRLIVLEWELLGNISQLRLILTHELFHFVWVRLSNAQRWNYRDLVYAELWNRARGEIGESAAVAKKSISGERLAKGSVRFKDYLCESFCDTAAFLFSGVPSHSSFKLAQRWRKQRTAWFGEIHQFRV